MKIPIRILAGILAVLLLLSLAACFDEGPIDDGDLLTGLPPSDEIETTSTPTPTDTPEPTDTSEPVSLAEIQEQPEGATIVLTAETAVFDPLGNMILEPDDPPYNVGGWIGGGWILWNEEFTASGVFELGLYYAKAYSDVPLECTLVIDDEVIPVTLPGPTSADAEDWSVYTYARIMEKEFTEGIHTIELYPGTDENPFPDAEYFINLRRIAFTPQKEDSGGGSGFADFTREQRLEILRYDEIDMGNPNSAYAPSDVYAFIAWYTNDQYGLDITADDVEAAIDAIEGSVPEGDEGYGYLSRLYHVCAYYELYPPEEVRDAEISCQSWIAEEFGTDPLRAKDDTDAIPSDYFLS